MSIAGKIVSVDVLPRGSQLLTAAASGATSLSVEAPGQFDTAGGLFVFAHQASGGFVNAGETPFSWTTVTTIPDPSDQTRATGTLAITPATTVDEPVEMGVWLTDGVQVIDDVVLNVDVGGDDLVPVVVRYNERDHWRPLEGIVDPPVACSLSDDQTVLLDADGYTPPTDASTLTGQLSDDVDIPSPDYLDIGVDDGRTEAGDPPDPLTSTGWTSAKRGSDGTGSGSSQVPGAATINSSAAPSGAVGKVLLVDLGPDRTQSSTAGGTTQPDAYFAATGQIDTTVTGTDFEMSVRYRAEKASVAQVFLAAQVRGQFEATNAGWIGLWLPSGRGLIGSSNDTIVYADSPGNARASLGNYLNISGSGDPVNNWVRASIRISAQTIGVKIWIDGTTEPAWTIVSNPYVPVTGSASILWQRQDAAGSFGSVGSPLWAGGKFYIDNLTLSALPTGLTANVAGTPDAWPNVTRPIETRVEALEQGGGSDTQSQIDSLDSRVDTLEGYNAGSRLTTLEGYNAGTRLTAVESKNTTQDSRLAALESAPYARRYITSNSVTSGTTALSGTTETLLVATAAVTVTAGQKYQVVAAASASNSTAGAFTTLRAKVDTSASGVTGTQVGEAVVDHGTASRTGTRPISGDPWTAPSSGTYYFKLTAQASAATSTVQHATARTSLSVDQIA